MKRKKETNYSLKKYDESILKNNFWLHFLMFLEVFNLYVLEVSSMIKTEFVFVCSLGL